MAEAAAVIGLVASIASLIDLGAKVVSRINEFTSKTSEVPESFRSLANRLPLLTSTLDRIRAQANTQVLRDDGIKALRAIVESMLTQVGLVQACLSKILPSDGATKLDRAFKALKSLGKEDKVRQAVDQLHRDIDVLVLRQVTHRNDVDDRILDALTKLTITTSNGISGVTPFGVCLGLAPQIDPGGFLGREKELQQLQDWLLPHNHRQAQCIVSISGLGGMGKTQLSLAHVRQCGNHYSSVFWVNAKDESTLRQTLAGLAMLVFPSSTTTTDSSVSNEALQLEQVKRWLSEPDNGDWLLIFDNYDDPSLPSIRSPTGYDIRPFFPTRAQGCIIITTRSTKLTFSKQLRLQRLHDSHTAISILSHRAGADLSEDTGAAALALRLGGLPLALSTAGTYIERTGISCREYLEQYESAWEDLVGSEDEFLLEYEERTLASTWSISLNQVRALDEDAARLLGFLAYFSYTDIWYELFQTDDSDDVSWLHRVTRSKISFQKTISVLRDYSFIDVLAGSYQIHPCLHDWLIGSLNTPPNPESFRLSLNCISTSMVDENDPGYFTTSQRLLEHAEHLQSPRFDGIWQSCGFDATDLHNVCEIAGLLRLSTRFTAAEKMYRLALQWSELTLGSEHEVTLDSMHGLGNILGDQGNLEEARGVYQRALRGREKTCGPNGIPTLDTVYNMGILYQYLGQTFEAEAMYQRALRGWEMIFGPNGASTLEAVGRLGVLYQEQGKLVQAEELYQRAIHGKEKIFGPSHTSTLDTVIKLGSLYNVQGKVKEAEEIFHRVLRGTEKTLGPGPDHILTLDAMGHLGGFYRQQGKLLEAEDMYQRVLKGREKIYGPDHRSTHGVINNLGIIYKEQGNFLAAEEKYQQAFQGCKNALGETRTGTYLPALIIMANLGNLYGEMGMVDKAKDAYQYALDGRRIVLGRSHEHCRMIEKWMARLLVDADAPTGQGGEEEEWETTSEEAENEDG